MKRTGAIAVGLAALLGVSCGGRSPSEPRPDSRIQVYVHWEDMGRPDKRLQVLELGIERLTDESGIAEFLVPAGAYTLRAYGINELGPPPLYLDFAVTTTPGKTTRVDVVDCVPCVAPSEG